MDGKGLLLAAICLVTAGCGTGSIHRTQTLDAGKIAVITVDAKQRHLLVSPESVVKRENGGEETTSIQRFCAEPSPDVFSVVAQSLSANGTFGQTADPKAIEAALSAAFSSAEQGSTIPRTQTINMLRELMYRTCERYLNGAYGRLELPIQAVRDQRLMVSILAIESLTGAVAPRPVVIGAQSNAEAGASGAEAAVRLDNAFKDMQSKAAAQQNRQNEYNDVTAGDKKHCEQISEAVAKKEEDKLPQELKDKKAKCATAAGALADAKKAASDSASHYTTLKSTIFSGGPVSGTSASLMSPVASGGIDRAHSDSIERVAATVQNIVLANLDQDEFDFLCLKVLDPRENTKLAQELIKGDTSIAATCAKRIESKINNSIEIDNVLFSSIAPEQIEIESRRISSRSDELFEKFWSKISKDERAPNSSEYARMKASKTWWPSCFTSDGDKNSYSNCFRGLVSWKQRELSK